MNISIRTKGFIKLSIGLVTGVATGYLLHSFENSGTTVNPFYLIAIAAPAAWSLGGLLELVTNRPFTAIDALWNSLKGWQRGFLGIFVVILAFIFMITAVAIAGYFGLI